MVVPASKTNDGMYFLSNLDQNLAFFVEILFCFDPDERKMPDNAIEVLKKSLAAALDLYYPLAGKLSVDSNNKLVVNCNGGVLFVEAIADTEIEALGDINGRDQETLAKLVHAFPHECDILQLPLLTIQVTRFKCGGFILGVVHNHSIADTVSVSQFMNSWAEITRGAPLTIPPFLDRSLLKSREPLEIKYPHHEFAVNVPGSEEDADHHQEEQHWQSRSFHFSPEKLDKLKRIATDDGLVSGCTSFTSLTAFFWQARTRALNMEPHQEVSLLVPVDGRSRFEPPLPKGFFGNGIALMCCLCTAGELAKNPLSFAVKLVQEAISSGVEDYFRSAIDCYEVRRGSMSRHMPTNTLVVSTWIRVPWKACDFGWANAAQLGCATVPVPVGLFTPPRNERNGINLLMRLPAASMEIFQEMVNI